MNKSVKIIECVLRDGQESVLASRLKLKDLLPVLERLDCAGYEALEAWGGEVFNTSLKYHNEDPWKCLKEIRQYIKRTKLMIVIRGQALVGYKIYPDDIVERFVKKVIDYGVDWIRVGDPLNDLRNLELTVKIAKNSNIKIHGTVLYVKSPDHDINYMLKKAEDLKNMGVDTICIKDASGILEPVEAGLLVKKLKEDVQLPVELHCHNNLGFATMTYLKAVEAGVDYLDTVISPLALRYSLPSTESIIMMLKNSPYDTFLNNDLIFKIAEYFIELGEIYNFETHSVLGMQTKFKKYPLPGSLVSDFADMLRVQKLLNRADEVFEEMFLIRKELGYPPLSMGVAQMLLAQACTNILLGKRYKLYSKEFRSLVKGKYGMVSNEIDKYVKKKVIGFFADHRIIKERAGLKLPHVYEKNLENLKNQFPEKNITEEDVLSYSLFPTSFTKFKNNQVKGNIKGQKIIKAPVYSEPIEDDDDFEGYPI